MMILHSSPQLAGFVSRFCLKTPRALRREILAVGKAARLAHPYGCNNRANAGQRRKPRRPEGFRANAL